jgi:hypothetical protein
MSGDRPMIDTSSNGMPTVGETLLVTVCGLEPGRAGMLLPGPLEPVRDEVYFYLVWATIHSELFPLAQRSFLEANVVLPCLGPEGEGTWFLRAYFPGRHMVRHAMLSGWSGEQAEVAIGRVPAAVQALVWPPAHAIGGWVARDGRRLLEMTLSLTDTPVAMPDSPLRSFNRVYGVRQLAGRRDVTLEHHVGEDRISRFQAADARLTLADELRELLGPIEIRAGYLAELGIVLGGSSLVGTA